MKRTKYNTKMHLSQRTQVAATAEMWERTEGERAAVNAASTA